MTETVVEPAAAEIAEWLGRFEQALAAGDAVAASELFGDDSFWRDLVAFTWNLKTLEGPEEIRAMLESQLPHVQPTGFRTTEPPSQADGITEAWIAFETAVGRGTGVLRLRDGKAWTLLTALERAQGPRGAQGRQPPARRHPRRAPGPPHLAGDARARGARARPRGAARGRHRRRRAGRHRPRRPAAPARRPDDHRRAQRASRRLLAQALQVALPARPGLVRPPAVPQVPRELAGVLAEGQDRRLARDVHAGHGAQLLGLDGGEVRDVRPRGRGVAPRRRARRRRAHAAAEAARHGDGHGRQARGPRDPGHGRLQRATSTTPPSTPGPTRTRASAASSSARTTPRTTSARRCGRRAPPT